jgi:putative restriction endonuclease
MWLEMPREESHGGPGWDFGTCLWSPTERNGGGRWGYWDLMQKVKRGDVVLHLRGKKRAAFVGHSVADADCYVTTERPQDPGPWEHASKFYRVPLREFCPFDEAPLLSDVFLRSTKELVEYHNLHSPVSSENGRFLFFVPQAGRLQCQNGAYLSEVDDDLLKLLIGEIDSQQSGPNSVYVGSGLTTLATRIGQNRFSLAVRENFQHRCCFPGCSVDDDRFLIGAHIVRWSDAISLRGEISNGLCLCLMHDKAFETGVFTIDDQLRVQVNLTTTDSKWLIDQIAQYRNEPIRLGVIEPNRDCLEAHRIRISSNTLR